MDDRRRQTHAWDDEALTARLRRDAPAWRDAVACGAATPRDQAAAARWRLPTAMAAAASVAVAGWLAWPTPERSGPPEPLAIELPAVDAVLADAGRRATLRLSLPSPEPAAAVSGVARSVESRYLVEASRLTEDVRRAVSFVVGVLPAGLAEPRETRS